MKPKLHAGRFRKALLKGVDDEPLTLAHIERDEKEYAESQLFSALSRTLPYHQLPSTPVDSTG
jgi:hypothetical protein